MSAVPAVAPSDPVVTPFHYVPVVGYFYELTNQRFIMSRIINLVDDEKEDTAKQRSRMGELTHLIELSIHFSEQGQKRSLFSIALCIVALVAFPHSLAVGFIAGFFIVTSLSIYVGDRNSIAARAKVLRDLEGKTTFGDEILKGFISSS
ncbi:MAG TPA: hypothetical protein VLG76_06975 [Rhabdochlamydiaceae bacterium]|nr:hypothetical protein [Rhabdochlamydiaceae bacterium]